MLLSKKLLGTLLVYKGEWIMKKMYENIIERLNGKKAELAERQNQFEVFWHNEKHS